MSSYDSRERPVPARPAIRRSSAHRQSDRRFRRASSSTREETPSPSRRRPRLQAEEGHERHDPASQPAPIAARHCALSRPWLKSYPPDVPATIDEDRTRHARRHLPHGVARLMRARRVESFGKRMTYAELGRSRRGGRRHGCRAQGLKKGDRVAIMLPNVMAYPAILFGVLRAGCTVVNVNPLYTPRELDAAAAAIRGARVLFVLENFAHTVEEAMHDSRSTRRHREARRPLGLKGAHRQFRRRAREKGGASRSSCPTRSRFARRAGARRARHAEAGRRSRSTTSRSCNIPAARPASPRRDALHRNVAANVAAVRGLDAAVLRRARPTT